jgi:hypothetical protein
MAIEITSRPLGEAPEWVRDQWIGLILPTSDHAPTTIKGYGVLSGPRSILDDILRQLLGRTERYEGYIVDTAEAIAVLEARSPEAAAWWRANTPHLLKRGRRLLFDSACCRPVAMKE